MRARRARPPRAPASTGPRRARSGLRAAQPRDADRPQLVAGGRHELRLGALAADERDLAALSPQRVGDRQRRHDVPRRPARRDHDPRRRVILAIAVTSADERAGRRRAARRDVQQQAHRRQQHDQVRRARRR